MRESVNPVSWPLQAHWRWGKPMQGTKYFTYKALLWDYYIYWHNSVVNIFIHSSRTQDRYPEYDAEKVESEESRGSSAITLTDSWTHFITYFATIQCCWLQYMLHNEDLVKTIQLFLPTLPAFYWQDWDIATFHLNSRKDMLMKNKFKKKNCAHLSNV